MTEVEQSDVGHKMEDVEFSVTPISGLYNDSVVDIVRLINKHL